MSSKDYNSLILKGLNSVRKTLGAEKEAISNLEYQYKTDKFSQLNLLKSLDILLSTKIKGGKIVLCGIGKSHKIGSKLSATLNSLSIQSVTLHPTEALHGDLGMLNDNDCIIMLSASGNTSELINMTSHVPALIPIILLTCNKTSKLGEDPKVKSLLYTELPPHLKEDSVHGVPAPTISASLSLIMADSVILALSELLEEDTLVRKKLFSLKHPGGSIGANLNYLNEDSLHIDGSLLLGSYTSLTSLDQLKLSLETVDSEPSSVSTSDDEKETLRYNKELQSEISLTDPKNICLVSVKDLNTLDETKFLRLITIYEIIIAKDETVSMGLKANVLKELYIEESVSKNNTWDSFLSMVMEKFKTGYI